MCRKDWKIGQRAGLVGTNTIRQNYSREGGLDYIVNNGGTITEAVSTQVWSGDAAVHVSIVNWLKGEEKGIKQLAFQRGDSTDSPYEYYDLEKINSALSSAVDLISAKALQVNKNSKACFQGQTHGHSSFLMKRTEGESIIFSNEKYGEVLGVHFLGNPSSEMIFGAAMAIEAEITLKELQEVVFPHPTVSEIFKETIFSF